MAPELKHGLEIKYGSEYGEAEKAAMLAVLERGAPTSGDACIAFEQAFADYCGVKHARCVSNGTAALFLSMLAAGVKPGDRVITTPVTWIATAASAVTLGAEIDFVDIDQETHNIDPAALEAAITPKTRAIAPVHMYGQCCDMDAILAVAEKHGLAVIEDACHTVGGTYKGRKAGAMGTAGCFSFHEQKNMSTLGEGGMVVTNDSAMFERIALYRSHCTRVYGASTKYCSLDETRFPMGKRFWFQDFDDCGYNFRMTDVQAAVGLVQLEKIDSLNQRRIENAAHLSQGLDGLPGLSLPKTLPGVKHVFHLYPVLVDAEQFGCGKEDLIYALWHQHGIRAGAHYIPLHWTTAFRNRGFDKGMFPVADRLGERVVTLPINPRMTREALDYLVDSVRALARV